MTNKIINRPLIIGFEGYECQNKGDLTCEYHSLHHITNPFSTQQHYFSCVHNNINIEGKDRLSLLTFCSSPLILLFLRIQTVTLILDLYTWCKLSRYIIKFQLFEVHVQCRFLYKQFCYENIFHVIINQLKPFFSI